MTPEERAMQFVEWCDQNTSDVGQNFYIQLVTLIRETEQAERKRWERFVAEFYDPEGGMTDHLDAATEIAAAINSQPKQQAAE